MKTRSAHSCNPKVDTISISWIKNLHESDKVNFKNKSKERSTQSDYPYLWIELQLFIVALKRAFAHHFERFLSLRSKKFMNRNWYLRSRKVRNQSKRRYLKLSNRFVQFRQLQMVATMMIIAGMFSLCTLYLIVSIYQFITQSFWSFGRMPYTCKTEGYWRS